jgi:hypothetical protein
VLVAGMRLKAGRGREALVLLKHAAARQPDDFKVRAALAGCLLQQGATAMAAPEAKAAQGLALTIDERLRAGQLVRATGGQAPSRARLLWGYAVGEYLTTALVVLLYLLLLVSPWLAGLWRRLQAEGAGAQADTA